MLWTGVQLADMVCSFSEAWVICEACLLLSLSAPGQLLCVCLTLFARREHDSLLWCLALVVMFLLSCGYLSLDFLGIILSIVSGIVISNDKNKTRPGESLLWAFWKWSHSVMSDSLQPHGLQPTRLLCPWDFPGKSTGVGGLAFSANTVY